MDTTPNIVNSCWFTRCWMVMAVQTDATTPNKVWTWSVFRDGYDHEDVVDLQNSAVILLSTRTVRLFENIWQSLLKKARGKTRALITKRKEKG